VGRGTRVRRAGVGIGSAYSALGLTQAVAAAAVAVHPYRQHQARLVLQSKLQPELLHLPRPQRPPRLQHRLGISSAATQTLLALGRWAMQSMATAML
jgi:hypothetical protein